jgi:BlaI family penicillinase repressor
LEEKGFLSHETLGTTYRYFTVITEEEYRNRTLKNVVKKYFDNSYLSVVSSLIKEETISVDEVRQLLDEVEKPHDKDSTKK